MISDTDAYRILGLTRGASTDEVKRAYRRLAKIHHPDAAGEKNLPRFLAIQAAYEQLTDGLDGAVRPRRPSAPRRPWDADPVRADATHRAYGGRARGPASGPRPAGGGAAPGAGPAGAAPGAAPGSGGASTGGAAASEGAARAGSTGSAKSGASAGGPTAGPTAGPTTGSTRDGRRRRRTAPPPGQGDTGSAGGPETTSGPRPAEPKGRKRKAATLGSTSYDGVDGPFEPDWRGASWYGTTSGTYWTLNPKEYADPRKHGPEYQARARRATPVPVLGRGGRGPRAGRDRYRGRRSGPRAAARGDRLRRAGRAADPHHELLVGIDRRRDRSGAGAHAPSSHGPPRRPDQRTDAPPPPDIGRAMADIGRALTDEGFGGMRGRVGRAIVGWLPIAFGIGWLAGEMTGCGRFAATCDSTADPFVLLLQAAVLAVLLLVPALASVTVMGSIALLSTAVAATLILSATGRGHRRRRAPLRPRGGAAARLAGRHRHRGRPPGPRALAPGHSRILRSCHLDATTRATCPPRPRNTSSRCACWTGPTMPAG